MTMKGPDKDAMAYEKTGARHAWLRLPRVGAASALMLTLTAASAEASERSLVLFPDPVLLPLMILLFAILIVPVNTLLFKPIFRVIEDREDRIDGTLSRAERLGTESEELLARYDGAIAEVRDEAERERKRSHSDARARAAAEIDRARAAAEREIESARSRVQQILEEVRPTIRTQAEELAGQVAERILGRPLS